MAEIKEFRKMGSAYVRTARPITEEQKKNIETRLLETTKYMRFGMHYSIDQSLIGGIVIQIGDRVMDSSIATQLTRMQKELPQIQI